MPRPYLYVGPPAILRRAAAAPPGSIVASVRDLQAWLRATGQHAKTDSLVAVTFVVDADGHLRVADRGSEHVACAGGGPVLSAGELFLRHVGDTVEVAEASNQSTGYCPEPQSWPAVAAALDRAGIEHPGRFTQEVIFRRCRACGQRNVVKDGYFVCGVCGAELPAAWNFDGREP